MSVGLVLFIAVPMSDPNHAAVQAEPTAQSPANASATEPDQGTDKVRLEATAPPPNVWPLISLRPA